MFLILSNLLNILRPQIKHVLWFDAGTLSQVPVSLPHSLYIQSVENYLALFKIALTEIHTALWSGLFTLTSNFQISKLVALNESDASGFKTLMTVFNSGPSNEKVTTLNQCIHSWPWQPGFINTRDAQTWTYKARRNISSFSRYKKIKYFVN